MPIGEKNPSELNFRTHLYNGVLITMSKIDIDIKLILIFLILKIDIQKFIQDLMLLKSDFRQYLASHYLVNKDSYKNCLYVYCL